MDMKRRHLNPKSREKGIVSGNKFFLQVYSKMERIYMNIKFGIKTNSLFQKTTSLPEVYEILVTSFIRLVIPTSRVN